MLLRSCRYQVAPRAPGGLLRVTVLGTYSSENTTERIRDYSTCWVAGYSHTHTHCICVRNWGRCEGTRRCTRHASWSSGTRPVINRAGGACSRLGSRAAQTMSARYWRGRVGAPIKYTSRAAHVHILLGSRRLWHIPHITTPRWCHKHRKQTKWQKKR